MKALEVFLVFLLLIVHKAAPQQSIMFPPGFKFGAASAAYQIEGGWNQDGKTPSIWDIFTHRNPEAIKDRSTGDVSADSYRYYVEDVGALNRTGVTLVRGRPFMS